MKGDIYPSGIKTCAKCSKPYPHNEKHVCPVETIKVTVKIVEDLKTDLQTLDETAESWSETLKANDPTRVFIITSRLLMRTMFRRLEKLK